MDLIDFVPPADINKLKQDSDVAVWQGPSNRPVFLHLDSNRDLSPSIRDNDGNPLWPNPTRDWRVRKAISKSISREAIVEKVMEGNAIIAFFGAPITLADHASRTCLAAIDMQKRLGELREEWKKEGKHELFMRIGMNTGQVVVGNMGSTNRMD